MKTMTCKELGGACDKGFSGETFGEVAKQSHEHGMEMHEKKDEAHLKAMQKMKEKMQNPKKMAEWMNEKKIMFENR